MSIRSLDAELSGVETGGDVFAAEAVMLHGQDPVSDDLDIGSGSADAQKISPIRKAMTRICAWCRRIKVSDGTWQVERRKPKSGSVVPSHGICPDCCRRLT